MIGTEDGGKLGIEEGIMSKKKSDVAHGKISWNIDVVRRKKNKIEIVWKIDVVSDKEKNNVPFQKEKVGAHGRQV